MMAARLICGGSGVMEVKTVRFDIGAERRLVDVEDFMMEKEEIMRRDASRSKGQSGTWHDRKVEGCEKWKKTEVTERKATKTRRE
jgi:hypothetical protein